MRGDPPALESILTKPGDGGDDPVEALPVRGDHGAEQREIESCLSCRSDERLLVSFGKHYCPSRARV